MEIAALTAWREGIVRLLLIGIAAVALAGAAERRPSRPRMAGSS